MDEAVALARAEPASRAYEARKLSPRCTREGCKRKAKDDSQYCVRCHRKQRKLKRESWARKYERRLAARLCVRCPGNYPNPATPGSTACLGCRIKRNRVKISDAGLDVDLGRADRIVAATSKDSGGRIRYRGQGKRGQQPKWQLNLQDLRHVKEDMVSFEQGLQILADPESLRKHASDRGDVERKTADVGKRMTRRTGDILERLGHRRDYPQGTPTGLPDPDDSEDTTLTYKRTTDAARVAAAARPGLYVYAPPLDVVSGRRETAKEPKPPDLGPLRAALGARGLELAAEGAFYWIVTERHGRRDGE